MKLNFIILQSDANPSNPWVKDYISIARLWEEVARRYNASVEGHISPYGINTKVGFNSSEVSVFTIEIDKRLENIRSGPFSLKPWPIVSRVKVHFGFCSNQEVLIRKNTFWNFIWGKMQGFRVLDRTSLIYMQKGFSSGSRFDLNFLESSKEFFSFKVTSQKALLHLLYIPEDYDDVSDLIETCKKIHSVLKSL